MLGKRPANMDAEVTEPSGRMSMNRHSSWRAFALAAVLIGVATGASACSAGSAVLGGSASTTSTSTSSSNAATTSTSTTSAASPSPAEDLTSKLLKYAQCMRSHGVLDYPDPIAAGSAPHSNPDVRNFASNSPAFQTAAHACRNYEVGQPSSSGAQTAELVAKLLKYVQCMRSHGVSNFPDPTSTGGLTIPNSIDENGPLFTRANNVCSNLLPAGSPTMSAA